MIFKLRINEKANAFTHLAGLLLSVVGMPLILANAIREGNFEVVLGTIAFCFGLLAVYSSSTIYHSVFSQRMKELWRKIDHIAIYFLIAGTYTAYILRYLNDQTGYIFLGVHWLLVLGGVIFKLFYCGKFEIFSTILYLLLGWMVVFILKPLTENMSDPVLYYILAGGIAYSVGVIFYVWERYKINHSIWHVFVILGSAAHYAGLYISF